MPQPKQLLIAILATVVACTSEPVAVPDTPAALAHANSDVAATAGVSFTYDATLASAAFTGTNLTYTITFSPAANGLAATNGVISGTPVATGPTVVVIKAANTAATTASDTFIVYTFAANLATPVLPATSFHYTDAALALPANYLAPGAVAAADNTPADNRVTDAGATLGRVLFYDPRLSANDRVSCSSCHLQALGFSDTARFSHGFQGGVTTRHAMSLGNARYYRIGRFFWDDRAATLEAQTLMPIQNTLEMGMTLENLVTKLRLSTFYAPLFQSAFGSSDITADRVSRALAQFVRSMSTYQSKFDVAAATGNFTSFTAQEDLGRQLFMPVPGGVPSAGCDRCHGTAANVSDDVHNNGLDVVSADTGAGRGRFKAPSLRNIAVRSAFMHDGRFTTLRQVVDFYNTGVNGGPDLDGRLRVGGGAPLRLNLSPAQVDALVAFLGTLTDPVFLSDPKLSNPFVH